MIKVDIHVQADQIDEAVNRLSSHYYEVGDYLAEKLRKELDRMRDQAFVTAWTREQWESHMVVMAETLIEEQVA
jgi:hypothetical protein